MEFCQKLEVKEITQKEIWEDFLMRCGEKTFLDSWDWGEFQKAMGSASGGKVWRLGAYEDGQGIGSDEQLVAIALVVKIQAKRGTFLFIPHGPVLQRPDLCKFTEVGSLSALLNGLKKIAKDENCSFIRIAPIWLRNEENIKIFKDLGFRSAPIHMHPEATWELDVTPSEEQLLMNMRKTTRYLIRQAEKDKDIEIVKTQDIKSLERFNELYQATVNRHHFVPFSLGYLKNEFFAFQPDNQPVRQAQGCPEGQIAIFLGKYKGEVVASAIIVFWQGIGFYHHGASSAKYSKTPVSYLLQWEAIKEAKKRGCKLYNFWGIVPLSATTESVNPKSAGREADSPKGCIRNPKQYQNPKSKIQNKTHPWAGLTLFKMGFGGYKKEYVKTQDLVLSSRYWLNFVVEKIRKTKRGL